MSNTRYIEISSMYRDRTMWPLAAEFVIPISQSGTNTPGNAIDPVSSSMPIFAWTSNNLLVGGSSVIPVLPNANTANIVNPGGVNTIGYCSDTVIFVITTLGQPQQLRNYYAGLVLNYTNVNSQGLTRIIFSYYLGVDSTGKHRTLITTSTLSDDLSFNDKIFIYDPTDFSDVNNPIVWVPNGPYQENAFNGYVLYNETINQYRPILRYDNNINVIILDTSGSATSTASSGPITTGVGGWNTTDSFSIRIIPPTVPELGISNPIISSVTNTSLTINYVSPMSTVNKYYKGYYLRVLPTGKIYDYTYIPVNSKNTVRIDSYIYDSGTSTCAITISPVFSVLPSIGDVVEFLKITEDNFNPFTYGGSLESHQEMVCYEMQLVSLTLPNATLTVGLRGRIAYYPYVYVEISNVSATGSGLKNIIYSNNPHATSIIFIAPIYDIQNPESTPFVRIDGGGMHQTIKFKPNDNLYFKVTLGNGQVYKTILEEFYSPATPNPLAQITALFSFKRI